LYEFAIWCAEQALMLVPSPDPRSVAALQVKRRWLDGAATDADLAAALDAAWFAALGASRAALDAVLDAAWAASRDAAWAATEQAQNAELERLLLVLGPTH
jgi:hypothetical protein